MKKYIKKDFPVEQVRRILEPGPIVLVSSAYKDEADVMTMGWHMVMEFTPSLIGCVIASSNHSFGVISKSGECVINVPTVSMVDIVCDIGNVSGDETDKFAAFGLTPRLAEKVGAPLIDECFASFECRLYERKLVKSYNFFIFEVVKAHVAASPRYPRTLHYHGQGIFTASSGRPMNKARRFTKWKKTSVF